MKFVVDTSSGDEPPVKEIEFNTIQELTDWMCLLPLEIYGNRSGVILWQPDKNNPIWRLEIYDTHRE